MGLPYVHNPLPRKMPAENAIRWYWFDAGLAQRKRHSNQRDFLKKGFCFACFWELGTVRAHIVARWNGGSDDASNLHMLCRTCHYASESIEGEDRYWNWFDERTPHDSAPDPLRAILEHEAKVTLDRTKAALAAYKARGGVLGTNNLTAEGTAKGSKAGAEAMRRKAMEEIADVVPLIRGLRADGLTQSAIAQRLNDLGHTTRTGKPWGQVQVLRCLERIANVLSS